MDFFEHQERARRNTSRLVFFYVLAVALILLSVYFAFALTLGLARAADSDTPGAAGQAMRLWNPGLFAMVTAGTLLVVMGGTAYKVMRLSQGGSSVAALLGGRRINRNTAQPDERKVLNVVEEMAIAAGIPVPPVFLLENETGINAFAAGFAPEDAVIGITRGAMGQLSRDELQGVIAHEFSHIFNGDMRLNIRLMGILHGILLIGLIGYWLLRSSMYSNSYGSSKKGKGNSAAQIAILGLALSAIGFVGVFFAKLIKSAVSRQREFLADAAAVQFTRNPTGIAGALKKIGGLPAGSKLKDAHAEEASHFFFANGLSSAWFSLMATHPPLAERIRRLDPAWAGINSDGAKAPPPRFDSLGAGAPTPRSDSLGAGAPPPRSDSLGAGAPPPRSDSLGAGAPPPRSGLGSPGTVTPTPALAYAAMAAGADARTVRVTAQEVVATVGAPQPAHLRYSQNLLAALPAARQAAAHEPAGARALIYNLLLSGAGEIRARQQQVLKQSADPAACQAAAELDGAVQALPAELRLPLADLAIATLKELTPPQYEVFHDCVEKLILADAQVELFEYALYRMLQRHLAPFFTPPPSPAIRYYSLKPLLDPCIAVLSCLAYWGDESGADARKYFDAGLARLVANAGFAAIVPAMRAREDCGVRVLDAALQQLAQAEPALKKRIMDACVACVAANGAVNAAEAQVLRAVGDALGCPIPPIMAKAA